MDGWMGRKSFIVYNCGKLQFTWTVADEILWGFIKMRYDIK